MAECRHCKGTGQQPNWRKMGRLLRKRRVKAGVALRELARQTGMSPAHLSDMELGRRSMGGPKAQLALAKFHLSADQAFRSSDCNPAERKEPAP